MSSLKLIQDEKNPWYEKGLNFKCTGCGGCCTGSPGYVWVSEEEIEQMAEYLKISIQDFSRQYLRRVHNKWSLRELTKQNYDCVFLKEKKCQIYPVRPKQCQTFPWWVENLKSLEAWNEAAKNCEGISLKAPLVELETIQEQLNR